MWDLTPIQPVAAIIGAIITATAAALVTYSFVVKRKRILFVVDDGEELTAALRAHRKFFLIKIGDKELLNLNRGTVRVKNTGNTPISDFKFEVVLEGTHGFRLAEVVTEDLELRRSVKVLYDESEEERYDPVFKASVPFLNPKEKFEFTIFYDGRVGQLKVYCRMEDLKYRIRRSDVLVVIGTAAGSHWWRILNRQFY